MTGLAALLMSFADGNDNPPDYNLHVHPDDVEQLIRRSAEDPPVGSGNGCTDAPGFDDCFGEGRINARAALDLLNGAATLTRGVVPNGGTIVATSPAYTANLHVPSGYGLDDGAYTVVRFTVERTISIAYEAAPQAWGRGGGPLAGSLIQVGWGEEENSLGTRYSYGLPYTEVAAVSATSLTLRTFVYEVYPIDEGPNPPPLGFYPTTPANAAFAYTLLGVPCPGGGCSEGGAGVREAPSARVTLDGVQPNPFGARAEVWFALPSSARVHLAVYDVLGREVALLVDGERETGAHRVWFEAGALPAGVYVVRLTAGTATLARRMTRLR